MAQLTPYGARRASKKLQLGHLSASWLSTAETFTVDSGRCPQNKLSTCGKRLLNAQGDKMGSWMRIYAPESDQPVAQSVKLMRQRTRLGMVDIYELTMSPG